MTPEENTRKNYLNKCIVFMHMPKCAGSSIVQLIGDNVGWEKVAKYYDPEKIRAGINIGDLESSYLLTGHFGFNFVKNIDHPHTRLTFLREPKARIISCYRYWKTLDGHDHNAGVSFTKKATNSEK